MRVAKTRQDGISVAVDYFSIITCKGSNFISCTDFENLSVFHSDGIAADDFIIQCYGIYFTVCQNQFRCAHSSVLSVISHMSFKLKHFISLQFYDNIYQNKKKYLFYGRFLLFI